MVCLSVLRAEINDDSVWDALVAKASSFRLQRFITSLCPFPEQRRGSNIVITLMLTRRLLTQGRDLYIWIILKMRLMSS